MASCVLARFMTPEAGMPLGCAAPLGRLWWIPECAEESCSLVSWRDHVPSSLLQP